jgi:hypothetical protein
MKIEPGLSLALGPLLGLALLLSPCRAAEWQSKIIATSSPVEAIANIDGEVAVATGTGWLRAVVGKDDISFTSTTPPQLPTNPPGALPDGHVAIGRKDIARAWLANPTTRYDHRVLGDAVEAASLMVEYRDGHTARLVLGRDAVFEDLEPRIADLNKDGHEEIVLVKSYLRHGSALAVIVRRHGHLTTIAETPPLGAAHRWLNPAGIADFDGNGRPEIAAVVMPHLVGRLELWGWNGGRLRRTHAIGNAANHVAGSRVLHMSAVADFDSDGIADLAVPSFDRRSVRLIGFKPKPHDIAVVPLPSRAASNFGRLMMGGAPALLIGLEDGQLVLVRKQP